MARYRIYLFDAKDHVTRARVMDCADDDEALRLFGSSKLDDAASELWQGRRLVRRSLAGAPRAGSGRMAWPRL